MGIISSIRAFFSGNKFIKVILGQQNPTSDTERFYYDWLTDDKTKRIEQWKLFIFLSRALGMPDSLIAENLINCINESMKNDDKLFGKILADSLEKSFIWPTNPTNEQLNRKVNFEIKFSEFRASLETLDKA